MGASTFLKKLDRAFGVKVTYEEVEMFWFLCHYKKGHTPTGTSPDYMETPPLVFDIFGHDIFFDLSYEESSSEDCEYPHHT